MPASLDELPFHVDHIVAKQHGGRTAPGNLALCCSCCNVHKGTNLSGIDPTSKRITALFHPRKHRWSEHFVWSGPVLVGLTPQGRATIRVLKINDSLNVRIRDSLMREGQF